MAASMRSVLARLSISDSVTKISSRPHLYISPSQSHNVFFPIISHQRCFTVSAYQQAKAAKSSRKKKRNRDAEPDPRIKNFKVSLPRKGGAPLRFARNRALRHWTIHRAWMLFQRQEREREERELMRMYQSMSNACEELRKTAGPGTRDEGYLYRVAMEKKGTYGYRGFPIEYARPQTETPAREPWNHGWTRG